MYNSIEEENRCYVIIETRSSDYTRSSEKRIRGVYTAMQAARAALKELEKEPKNTKVYTSFDIRSCDTNTNIDINLW